MNEGGLGNGKNVKCIFFSKKNTFYIFSVS
jgi:hypothetical protein